MKKKKKKTVTFPIFCSWKIKSSIFEVVAGVDPWENLPLSLASRSLFNWRPRHSGVLNFTSETVGSRRRPLRIRSRVDRNYWSSPFRCFVHAFGVIWRTCAIGHVRIVKNYTNYSRVQLIFDNWTIKRLTAIVGPSLWIEKQSRKKNHLVIV